MNKLFFLLLIITTIFTINSKIIYKKPDIYNLVSNPNLYLFNFENRTTESYINELRYQIIRKIRPLVIVTCKFDPSYCSLYGLVERFGINIESVRSTNYIEAIGLLYPGKMLLLHNKKGMIVKITKDGTDVFSIAKKYNKDVEEICLINEIPPTYKFQQGEYVFIPDRYIRFKDFMLPVFNTRITSGFGMRKHPIFGILRFHEGIDLKQKYGAAVRAASDGKVIFAGWAEGYGKLVILKHRRDFTTYYGHLSKIKVKVGQYVYKGQVIGNVGTTGWTTGPHLHFEVRKNGLPVDPKKILY